MSKRLEAFEQLMVTMERPAQPMHAGSVEIFQLPEDAPSDFVETLVEKMRAVPAIAPFERALEGRAWMRWRITDVDMHYHVRHLRLPSPGSMTQLMEMAEGLYGGLLNRSLPLWEAWVIEGLEGGRFAIAFKAHHALTDGVAGMRRFLDSLSTDPKDQRVRAPWGDNIDSAVHARRAAAVARPPVSAPQRRPLTGSELLAAARALWPVKTQRSRLNGVPSSSARRFGACTLPLALMKGAGAACGATVNDVLVALVDHAANRYLLEQGDTPGAPLAALVAVSGRKEGETGGASNQVIAIPAALGEPTAGIQERLIAVRDALRCGKEAAGNLPRATHTGYTAGTAALVPQLLELIPAEFGGFAVSSMVVSNISPPRGAHYVDQPLYRAGARMESFYIQPIVNGGCLLNVTCMGYNTTLNVGIGSVPGAIDDPMRLGRYMVEALEELAEISGLAPSADERPQKRDATNGASKSRSGHRHPTATAPSPGSTPR